MPRSQPPNQTKPCGAWTKVSGIPNLPRKWNVHSAHSSLHRRLLSNPINYLSTHVISTDPLSYLCPSDRRITITSHVVRSEIPTPAILKKRTKKHMGSGPLSFEDLVTASTALQSISGLDHVQPCTEPDHVLASVRPRPCDLQAWTLKVRSHGNAAQCTIEASREVARRPSWGWGSATYVHLNP